MSHPIPMTEVRKHKKADSVWMVIHNDVYDVTKFLEEHPGGAEALLEEAGKDATQAFEDVGHSDDARLIMTKYKIGSLPATEQKTFIDSCCPGATFICPSVKKSACSVGSRASSRSASRCASPSPERVQRRVQTIVVPRESNKWKWVVLALGVAVVAGVVARRYMTAA